MSGGMSPQPSLEAEPLPVSEGKRTLALVGLAVLAAAALYLWGSYGSALSEPDEARYGEIAREMLVSGDWLTPHLNFVKYFEKPPLVYWATGLAFAGLGATEFAARLPSILSALLTLALTGWLARRLYGGATALLAVVCLAVSPLFGVLAIVLTLDMALTAFMTLAMCCAWAAVSAAAPTLALPRGGGGKRPAGDALSALSALPPPRRGRGGAQTWIRAAYAATALAMLVKGPVAAVLVGAAIFVFVLTHGGLRGLRPWLDWRAFALAAAIALPWFVLVGARNPEFWHFFIVDQHINRYVSSREHGEPIWFFLPVLPLALVPWGLVALFDPAALRDAWDPRTWTPGTRFCAIWAAVIVGFFSFSAGKLLTYVLPALPPLAVLCARLVLWSLARGRVAGLTRVGWLCLLGGLVIGLCAALLPLFSDHWRVHAIAPYLYAAAGPLAATGWIIGRLVAARRARAALVALGAGWTLVFAIAVAGRGVANEYRPLGLAAGAAMAPNDRLALYRKYVQGMAFYAGRRTILVGGRGELKFGSLQGDHAAWFWPTDADLVREWQAPGRLLVLFNRDDLDRLRPQLDPPPLEVAAKDKKVLVKNRP